MKKVYSTHDEEYNPASRIAGEIERDIENLELDCVNKEYIIIVEVIEKK